MKRFGFVLAALLVLGGGARGPAQPGPDAGRAYDLTPEAGPWVIYVLDYRGEHARELAAKLAAELRGGYGLQAFVFNFVDEEQRKERERVARLRDAQVRFLVENGFEPTTPIKVRTRRFEDQCAVMLGGYKDEKAARRDLNRVRKLKPPDPHKVALQMQWFDNPQTKTKEMVYVNPFEKAWAAPNPSVKRESSDPSKADPFLKRLNAHEPFSLLQCPRPFTLAVAQFTGLAMIETPSTTGKLLEKLGLGGKVDTLGASAMNAHTVADILNHLNLKAYVLHTRNYSLVTIEGFDSPRDPRIPAVQEQLATLKAKIVQLNQIPMLPEPKVILVPRP